MEKTFHEDSIIFNEIISTDIEKWTYKNLWEKTNTFCYNKVPSISS